jgi:hypothetical protein
MPRIAFLTCASVILCLQFVQAQAPAAPPRRRAAAVTDAPARLPVRRVVLYKNGIGYFEHLGRVRGDDTISVDFNSAQLNDVLKSLTVVDLGNGRVSGISYNSDAPLGERLGALRLAVGDRATLPQLLDALRGARLEVRVGGRVVTGRLLGVERRVHGTGDTAAPRDELTIVSDAGEIRTVELTPAASVRVAERDSANQVGSYLGLLASTRAPDRRRMTIATTGTGERDLLVSYVSEVPIWKTNYRIVLPPGGEEPLLQGWAIVDNTTGEDWNNVDLSLVAGAPQSFIQQISQPQYARRPVVQPSQPVLLTPQTHAATLTIGMGGVRGTITDASAAALPGVTVRLIDSQRVIIAQAVTDGSGRYALMDVAPGTYRAEFTLAGFSTVATDLRVVAGADTSRDAVMRVGALSETITMTGETPVAGGRAGSGGGVVGGVAGGIVGGNVERRPPPPAASPAQAGSPTAEPRDLGDLFEYRVSAPISILRNQSALVPIIRCSVAIERVSLWNGRAGARPLRALWLTNSTGLTLDAGAFSVVEGGAFAGEGLMEPLKPEERRLLSYAVDLGVQVESRQGDERRMVSRIVVLHGVIVEHTEQRTRRVYTLRNNDTTARTVVVEHPIRAGWTLAGTPLPVETSATAYRFAVPVQAQQTATLTVEEKRPQQDKYAITSLDDPQLNLLVRDSGDNHTVKDALAPILAKKASIAALAATSADRMARVTQISEDQQRVRENLQTLKDTAEQRSLVRRFAGQLSQQEDQIQALRRELADLDRMRQQADSELQLLIERLALDLAIDE